MILSPSSVTKAACKNLNDFDQQNLPSLYYSLFSKEIDMEKVNTIPQIFEQKTPSMVVIAREIGNEKIIAMIELYIIALDQFLNFNKSMTQMSIHETAELIYRTYFQLTITDVLYVFKNARLGRYGEIIGLNGGKILTWFDQHFDQRCLAAAAESEKEHYKASFDQFDRTGLDRKISEMKTEIRDAMKKHTSKKSK
jgi:hypothetical protein